MKIQIEESDKPTAAEKAAIARSIKPVPGREITIYSRAKAKGAA